MDNQISGFRSSFWPFLSDGERESISGTERVILKLNLLTTYIVMTNLSAFKKGEGLFQFRLYVLLLPFKQNISCG